jgi:hypothetical protein
MEREGGPPRVDPGAEGGGGTYWALPSSAARRLSISERMEATSDAFRCRGQGGAAFWVGPGGGGRAVEEGV